MGWREDLRHRSDPIGHFGFAAQPACPECQAKRTVQTIDRGLRCPNCGHTWNVERANQRHATDRAYAAAATQPGPACPRCQSLRTQEVAGLSAIHADFNSFSCRACGRMWITLTSRLTTD